MPKKTSPVEIVEVPAADEMDDETFIKHLEHRHSDECKIERVVARHNTHVWLPMYRKFHDRLHSLATPGQYDHVHEDDEDEEL